MPPPVLARTAATTSSTYDASTTASAPSAVATSSAAGLTSTATTRAPRALAIITAERPTPPAPCTATHWSAPTWPCATRARNAVANRQPSDAAATKDTSSGRSTTLASARGTATRSANDPGSVKPGWSWSGQTWASPARQCAHSPQPRTNGTVTRSPTDHRVTRGPTAAIVPAYSWPGTCGSDTGSCPRHACQSERHTPVAATATTTPSAGHPGSGTSATAGSSPRAR